MLEPCHFWLARHEPNTLNYLKAKRDIHSKARMTESRACIFLSAEAVALDGSCHRHPSTLCGLIFSWWDWALCRQVGILGTSGEHMRVHLLEKERNISQHSEDLLETSPPPLSDSQSCLQTGKKPAFYQAPQKRPVRPYSLPLPAALLPSLGLLELPEKAQVADIFIK